MLVAPRIQIYRYFGKSIPKAWPEKGLLQDSITDSHHRETTDQIKQKIQLHPSQDMTKVIPVRLQYTLTAVCSKQVNLSLSGDKEAEKESHPRGIEPRTS